MIDIDFGDRGQTGDGHWLAQRKGNIMWHVEEPRRVEPTPEQSRGVDGAVRLGKCYSLAANYVVDHPRAAATLVHGEVQIGQAKSADGSGLPIDHAWVEMGDVVYDGTQGKFYDRADYYEKMRAVAKKRYAPDAAREMMLKHEHYGPWRD